MLPYKQMNPAAVAGQRHQRCPGSTRPAHSSHCSRYIGRRSLKDFNSAESASLASSRSSAGSSSQVPVRPNAAAAAATVLALAGLSGVTYQVLSSASLPPLGSVVEAVGEAAAAAGVASASAAATAKLVLQDKFHLEWHKWVTSADCMQNKLHTLYADVTAVSLRCALDLHWTEHQRTLRRTRPRATAVQPPVLLR
jgi:hypothetical protein